MQIVSITRTNYLEDCIIEGYKGFFIQWELVIEGTNSTNIIDLCQKYCHNERFTKEQFLSDLQHVLSQCKNGYKHAFNIKSFYELEQKDEQTWIYTWKAIKQDYT